MLVLTDEDAKRAEVFLFYIYSCLVAAVLNCTVFCVLQVRVEHNALEFRRLQVYKHIKEREEELGKLVRNELKPADRVPEHLSGEYRRVLKPLRDRVLENLLRKFGALPPMNVRLILLNSVQYSTRDVL